MMTERQCIHHCLHKAAFTSRSDALHHLYKTSIDSGKLWSHKHVYECAFGNHFHLGRRLYEPAGPR